MRNNLRKILLNHKKWLLLPIFAVLYLQLAMGIALAAEPPQMALILIGEGKIGDETTIEAVLNNNDGLPIPGIEVTFYTMAQFANVNGEVEIGISRTNDQGTASLIYSPRTMGEQSIIARFSGNNDYEAMETSEKIIIAPGPQLHVDEAGLKVPGVGPWLFALAVAVVWGIFLSIMVLLELIARKGAAIPYREGYHE